MDFIITTSSRHPKPGIVIRRYGLYINKVSCEEALESFLNNNLPTGVFRKAENGYELTDKVLGCDGRLDEDGDEIRLDTLAYGLGFGFTRE